MGDVHEPVIGENFSVKQARKAIYKTYHNMIRLNDEAIKDIFETLANEENYPVILGSKYGMYQTSVVSALLLAALDVPESVSYEDYLLTNEAFNTKVLLDYASGFSEEVQDAVVCLTTCDDKYLKKAFDQLRRDHNSINDYFTSLGIDEDHRQKLRNLLLK